MGLGRVELPTSRLSSEHSTIESQALKVVGVEGIEPSNGGSKDRCLTTWLYSTARSPREKRESNPRL